MWICDTSTIHMGKGTPRNEFESKIQSSGSEIEMSELDCAPLIGLPNPEP
jgi:hypothetical protein